jgi:hypothetical protein
MSEIEMITEVWPDLDLPGPAELCVARDRLAVAIAAARANGSAPAAPRRPRRGHRRRIVLLGTAFTGIAVAAAAILVATAGPGHVPRPPISPRPAVSPLSPRVAAFVISRAEQALTTAERRNLIQEIHVMGQAASFTLAVPGRDRAASAPRAVIWTYRGLILTEGLTAAGQRVFDSSFRYGYSPHRLTISSVTVNDTWKTWWHSSVPIHMRGRPVPIWLPPQTCPAAALPSPSGSPGSNWPAEIRLALRCGQYHVAGTALIDGVSTIKVVPRYQRPPHGAHVISQVLWVSRSTYLPVRVRWSWPRAHGLSRGSLTGDFTWLAPTGANLASLRVTIPPGYRQLPPDGLGGAGFQMAPGSEDVVWPLS